MKKRFTSIAKQAAVIALSVTVFSGVGYVFAQPTVAPGAGSGVALPLNTGADAQTKTGNLTVNGSLTAGTLCLGGVCNTSWPGSSIQSGSTGGSTSSGPYYCTASNYDSSTGQYYCDISYGYLHAISTPGIAVSESSSVTCDSAYYGYGYIGGVWQYGLINCGGDQWSTGCAYSETITSSSASLSSSGVSYSGTCRVYGDYYESINVNISSSTNVLYIF